MEDKKSFDIKLMKRLLGYARPYWKYLLLTIVLMTVVTGLELLRPYLIKVSIDDYISGDKALMYEFEAGAYPDIRSTSYKGKLYIREKDLLKEGVDIDASFNKKVLEKKDGSYLLLDPDNKALAENLSQEDYRNFRQYDIDGIKRISFIFLLTVFLVFVFNYIQMFILNYTGQKIIYSIRKDIFSHIQHLSISYFDKNPIGKLVTRVTNDTESLNEMYTGVLINLFKDVFILIGVIIIMFRLNLKLTLVSLVFLPFIILTSILFRKKIRNVYRLSRTQLAKINTTLNENISGMGVIQVFKKEDKISREFDEINREYLQTSMDEVETYAVFRPIIEIIKFSGMAALFFIGGRDVLRGIIPFGILFAFIDYLQRFFEPILDLTEKYNILQSAMASSEKIFTILDHDEFIENREDPIVAQSFKGKIEFKNVWFSYDDENWVLKDLNFTIEPGEMVAFVGATGAGKSSIMNLITRFYDIQEGEILIDGVNIKDYDKYSLRKNIGVVLQDVFMFSGSIKDNIRLNNQDISDEEIETIAKYVNAHHFIDRLPKKYDEEVMERGATLSSGEKQLLSFARTLAFDPSILILDEATSSIDTETEILIQDALGKLTKGRTSIAVAHRLSTIQSADKIMVLNKGRIEEAGNHQELLQKQGIYYNLYKLQYKEDFKR